MSVSGGGVAAGGGVAVRYWSNHSSSCVNWEIGSGLWSPVSTSPLQTEIQSYNVAGDTGTNYVWD